MSEGNILYMLEALMKERDVQKLKIDYWQEPEKGEENEGSCLVKVSVEKEYV